MREHHRLRLADREAADGVAARSPMPTSARALSTRSRSTVAALHDAEQRPARLRRRTRCGSARPSAATAHGALDLLVARRAAARIRRAASGCRSRAAPWISIERSGVSTWAEPSICDWKVTPCLVELAQLRQRHDLEAAGIGEDRARPAHEAVQPAEPARRARRRAAASGDRCCRARCRRRAPRT